MHEPDYTSYSLNQLHDCLRHINSRKYPKRFAKLQKEIALRTEKGESFCEASINDFFASDIPLSLGIRAWWCFAWRSGTAALIFWALLGGLLKINTVLQLVSPLVSAVMQYIYWAIVIPAAGICIMMQVLAKGYSGYRLRVVKAP